MIDTSLVRVHQHAACITRIGSMGHEAADQQDFLRGRYPTGLPVRLSLTAGVFRFYRCVPIPACDPRGESAEPGGAKMDWSSKAIGISGDDAQPSLT